MSYRYFKEEEFVCSHTGLNRIEPEFIKWLDGVREDAGIPFKITSGYRHSTHPIEAKKETPGAHNRGRACDIAATDSRSRFRIVAAALRAGCKRIGIAETFVHLDLDHHGSREVIWLY